MAASGIRKLDFSMDIDFQSVSVACTRAIDGGSLATQTEI